MVAYKAESERERAATWLLRRNRSSPIRANFFDFKHRA